MRSDGEESSFAEKSGTERDFWVTPKEPPQASCLGSEQMGEVRGLSAKEKGDLRDIVPGIRVTTEAENELYS